MEAAGCGRRRRSSGALCTPQDQVLLLLPSFCLLGNLTTPSLICLTFHKRWTATAAAAAAATRNRERRRSRGFHGDPCQRCAADLPLPPDRAEPHSSVLSLPAPLRRIKLASIGGGGGGEEQKDACACQSWE